MQSIILAKLKNKVKMSPYNPIIIFPEGWNKEVQEAASAVEEHGYLIPVLVFKTKDQVPADSKCRKIVIEEQDTEELANDYYSLRKHKGMTIEQARKIVREPNFFATMQIYKGKADGYVGGIEYTTADTMRPALQIIKTAKESTIVSSAFIMEKGSKRLVFSDCAINVNPTSEQLAEITKQTVRLAKVVLDCKKTNTALLSFSTAGSAKSPEVDKVRKAYEILQKEGYNEANVFGEMQFDAAFSEKVRKKKAKDCDWKEDANLFIFPTLDAGNIGYKLVQRLGGYSAIGPIVMGLKYPVNDLSRGAVAEDIVGVAYTTAAQAIAIKESSGEVKKVKLDHDLFRL